MMQDQRIERYKMLNAEEQVRKQLYARNPPITVYPPRTESDFYHFFDLCEANGITLTESLKDQLLSKGVFSGVTTEKFVNINAVDTISAMQHARYMGECMHTHECFEIVCVCDGTAIQKIADTQMELQRGDFCVLAPDVEHDVKIFSDALVVNLQVRRKDFDLTFFKFLSETDVLGKFFRDVLYGGSSYSYLLFHAKDADDLISLVLDLLDETLQPKAFTSQYRFVEVSRLFVELLRRYGNAIVVGEPAGDRNAKIVPIIRYMQANCDTVSRKSVAEAFHYNESYFSRMFKEATGVTFKEMLTEIRMLKAKQILASSNLSNSDVSERIGFRSESNFYRQYKKRYGHSPQNKK